MAGRRVAHADAAQHGGGEACWSVGFGATWLPGVTPRTPEEGVRLNRMKWWLGVPDGRIGCSWLPIYNYRELIDRTRRPVL